MKQNIIIICSLVVLLGACDSGFLDIPPKSSSTEGNFFKTEEHFTQAVNDMYSSLRSLYKEEGFSMMEMRSDNTHYTRYEAARGYPSTDREKIADFLVAIENTFVRDMWKACYKSVSKANTIIDRIEDKDFSPDFTRKTVGQAKFVRAFAYFHLVQLFGGVPLQLTEVTNAEGNQIPRSSVADVYARIVADVKEAVEMLEPVTFPQNGAITQGAARMLYAYVLMTKPDRDYAEAEKQLTAITQMGYELEADFANVFEPAKKNGKEHIFSIQYQMGEQGQESKWLYLFMPKTASGDVLTGVENTNTVDDGGWNVPTRQLIDLFADGDKRRDVSLGIAVADSPDEMLKKIEDWFSVGDPQINDYKFSIPFVRKYHHAHTKVRNTDDNWPVYRYSDVLLLMAECLVEQGKNGQANTYVNQVRSRAGLEAVNEPVTAEVVAAERKLELAFENHRWFDLLRTGKALEVMKAYGNYIKSVDAGVPSYAYDIQEGYLLFPIPYLEMERNPELTQNPGYVN